MTRGPSLRQGPESPGAGGRTRYSYEVTTNHKSNADRAITLAQEMFRTGRHDQAASCKAALAAVPELKWSPDQLKARAFNPNMVGMFWSFGR